jgi:serine/threonine-protein kinase
VIAAELERWRTANIWLERLLDMPPEQRHVSLASASLDPELHACVQRLLAAAEQPDPRLEPGPDGLSMVSETDAPNRLAGRQVGAWELIEEIGRGGMSVVYRARRNDCDYEQVAAVKLLGLASLGTGGELRFEQERRVLASLRHPHIAGLVDGGVAEDGTPFLAMQLVEGRHINEYCDNRRLGLPVRVRLLVQVCEAVAHAHRNLVVHRDIKPGNILVTDAGVPVLLDFGIAKLLDSDAEATRTWMRALTPGYAAPEQVEGGTITTATDVHALGAVLRRLSAAFEPLPTDLRNVIDRAMHAEPERRYRDAQALSEDLDRWLQRLPVLASPDSASYRLRMFLRRRHGVAIASALAVVALLAGIGATLWQAGHTAEQARRAEASRDFLVDLFVAADPERSGANEARLEHLVDRGAQRIDASFAQTPALHAEMATLLGHLAMVAGQHARAGELLDTALARATDSSKATLRAEALYRLGMLANRRGEPAEAVARFDQAISALGADPDDAQALRLRLLPELALALENTGEKERARDLTAAALADARSADAQIDADQRARLLTAAAQFAADPAQQLVLLEEASNWFQRGNPTPFERLVLDANIGNAYRASADFEQARRHLLRSVEAAEQVWNGPASHKARLYNNLATTLARMGRLTEADDAFTQAETIFRALGDQGSPAFAALLNNRAVLLVDLELYEAAASLSEEAIAIATRHFSEDDFRVGILRNGLARARAETGDERAEAEWQRALAIARAAGNTQRIVLQLTSGARVALALGRPQLALERIREATELAEASDTASWSDHSWQVQASATCGAAHASLGQAEQADACFQRGDAVAKAQGDSAWAPAWRLHRDWGDMLRDGGELQAASERYREALGILEARGIGAQEPPHVALRERLDALGGRATR